MPWILVTLFRLIVPLSLLRWQLTGGILSILADNIDVVLLDLLGTQNLGLHYDNFDKALDTFFYLIAGYTTLKWPNKLARNLALSLLAYRTIGTILFEPTHYRPLLFIFPNVFITFYIVYLISIRLLKKDPVKSKKSALLFTTILTVPKLYQEYLFHVVQIPLYQTFQQLFPFFY